MNWIPRNSPLTIALICINLALFGLQFATEDLITAIGLLYGPAVSGGQWWRIVTSGFLHGGLVHIAFNMYLLYMLGPQLERSFGTLRFALMYFGALFGGSLAVLLFDYTQPTLGASGAVLGIASAMFVALWGKGINPAQSPVFGLVVLNIALPLLVPSISFWGHFGGVAAGGLMAFILSWLPDRANTVRVNDQADLIGGSPPHSASSLSQAALAVIVLASACVAVALAKA